ncbi:hypothetical protein RND71_037588 [Anisodus tanguticus]|uniref:Uncharacterized protein n=1 Tax=Anisodus tanguticus TaxID=243964 RepID=A0AAE1R0Q2_9SOLA|nr:hypothetical protein RND71_037588 [Anisodus tanguticus]
MLGGSLPEFPSNRSRQKLDLGWAQFSGTLPKSIGNLSMLSYVDLASCNFTGPLPSSMSNLTQLVYLDLFVNRFTGSLPSENSLSGVIPASLLSLPSLDILDLSRNKFSGQITDQLQNVNSPLTKIDLSANNLEGPLPEFLFELKHVIKLSLSSNNFSATVKLDKFTKLQNLIDLDLSGSGLSVKYQTGYGELLKILSALNLSLNQFTHFQEPYIIPDRLSTLDLHSNLLTEEILSLPRSAFFVDLSNNKFATSIPPDFGNYLLGVRFLSVANNTISGNIPDSLCKATILEVLDLSSNSLTGKVPMCFAEQMSNTLKIVNLGGNNLTSNLPGNFSEVCSLETMDLSHNLLEGKIPQSLSNCRNLKVLNMGNNKISDTFPCWLSSLPNLHVLVLHSNHFHGNIDCSGVNYSWPTLQIIDLASNNFSGILPRDSFLKMKAMMLDPAVTRSCPDLLQTGIGVMLKVYYLDKVSVTLKGLKVTMEKIFLSFISIDFSNNNFVGCVPETIGELKSLYLLNLSHNALTGQIPPAFGNLKQLGSLDLSIQQVGWAYSGAAFKYHPPFLLKFIIQ